MVDLWEPIAGLDLGVILAPAVVFVGFGFGLAAIVYMIGHVVWLICDLVR